MIGTLLEVIRFVCPGFIARHVGQGLIVSCDENGTYFLTLLFLHCFYPVHDVDELFYMIGEAGAAAYGWEIKGQGSCKVTV